MKLIYSGHSKWSGMAALLLVAIAGKAQVLKPLPLSEALQMAVQHSKKLQVDSLQYVISQSRVTQIKQGRLPELALSASYQRISNNVSPFVIEMPGASFTISPQILNQSYNSVQLTQLLYSGGRLNYTRQSLQKETEATKVDLEKSRIDLQKQVLDLWYNLYNATRSRRIIETNINTLQERKKDQETFLKQGLVLENDVLKIDLAISNLQNSLADVTALQEVLNDNLCIVTGLNNNTVIDIQDKPLTQTLPAINQTSDEQIWKQRPEVSGLLLRTESAAYRTKAVKANYWPTLSLFGTFNVDNPNQRLIPSQDKLYPTALAGVRLNWNISSLYTNPEKVYEAKLATLQLQQNREQVKEMVQSDVKTTMHELNKTIQKLTLVQKQLDQAKENYRVEQNKLQAQTTTPTDFLEANAALLQAELNLATAQANYELAYYKAVLARGEKLSIK